MEITAYLFFGIHIFENMIFKQEILHFRRNINTAGLNIFKFLIHEFYLEQMLVL